MNEEGMRILEVKGETVPCLPEKSVTLDRCRFCAHSRYFEVNGRDALACTGILLTERCRR
jgi:hypothetical protein